MTSNKNKAYKKLKEMPGPTSLPFFGTTLTSGFLAKDLMKNLEDRVRKFGLLVKQEHFWNHPIIEVFDADDIEKVLKADRTGLVRPGMDILVTYRTMRKDKYSNVGLTNSIGHEWLYLRARLTKTLKSPKFILNGLPKMNETCDDFIQILGSRGPHIHCFDKLTVQLVAENACMMTLGRRVGLLESNDKVKDFIDSHDLWFRALHNSSYAFPVWKFFPNKIWRDFVRCEDNMYAIADELTRETLEGHYEDGFFTEYLFDDKVSYGDKVLIVLDFLISGISTVANTVNFTVAWIAKHERVQKRLQEELLSALPDKNTPIDAEILKRLPYLKACLKESFRFTPTAPNNVRILDSDIQLRGYNIPAYTVLLCNTWYSCMQEKNFYRAKEFLPERWLHSKEINGEVFEPHREFVCRNFGFGKRICPGNRYSLQQLYVILAKIFRNFSIEYTDPLEYAYEFLVAPTAAMNFKISELPDFVSDI